ncbi:septal ring lytic transglycosylase RlpA family protein [Patescibacteria group bacterium]|nr:septal ring lytic transglycosylase RlpA family protein [Patescibacteria group bacterium]
MKNIFRIALTIFFLLSLANLSIAEEVLPFSDLYIGHKNFVAISTLKENGVIEGYDDGSFRPEEKINRAEALKMLTLASELLTKEGINEADQPEENVFTDVVRSAWYAKYISAAKDKKVINGYDDGTFKPSENINLMETLKIYMESLRTINYPETTEENLFADTATDSWYSRYAALAKERGLLYISANNSINPDQELTRGYLAEIIYRMQGYEKGDRFGKATFYGEAFNGRGTASGDTFDMNAMTAAHKTLPFDTQVQVTNLANGKTVIVKINDRGPYGPGRVLDLSEGAFTAIASRGSGIIDIKYSIIED